MSTKVLIRIISVAMAMLIAIGGVQSRTRTIRGKMQRNARTELSADKTITCDTLTGDSNPEIVAISRYDKPLMAWREAFVVTNTSAADTIVALSLIIDYSDLSGNQLHHRSCRVRNLNIPPGQSRSASIKSWDPQKSYYYHASGVGRTSRRVTPYEVKIAADTVFVTRRID